MLHLFIPLTCILYSADFVNFYIDPTCETALNMLDGTRAYGECGGWDDGKITYFTLFKKEKKKIIILIIVLPWEGGDMGEGD